MNKQFYQHYSGLKVAEDGEVFVPKSGIRKAHYTYGYLKNDGHYVVKYKGKDYGVHTLVYEVFKNNNHPIPDGYVVHHINKNPTDNRYENLLLMTRHEHQTLHHKGKLGAEHPRSKPIIGIHKFTNKVVNYAGTNEASRALDINVGNICSCLKGRQKSAGGYYWYYKDQ